MSNAASDIYDKGRKNKSEGERERKRAKLEAGRGGTRLPSIRHRVHLSAEMSPPFVTRLCSQWTVHPFLRLTDEPKQVAAPIRTRHSAIRAAL